LAGREAPRDPSIASYKISAFRRAIPLISRTLKTRRG
jgi:hypothetical protein